MRSCKDIKIDYNISIDLIKKSIVNDIYDIYLYDIDIRISAKY